MFGDYILAGTPREDEDSNETNTLINSGAVYVFKYTSENLQTTDIQSKNSLIYPNPTYGELFVKSDKKLQSLELYDIEGRKLLISDKDPIDISSLSVGSYILKIKYDDGSINTQKVIRK
ncbi:MAG: hypothetical protein DI529_12705 [Chryseobacterium sp.]|nr:MAG: hypothetical protein DI529_12705 [Chryseobacterium sp.]